MPVQLAADTAVSVQGEDRWTTPAAAGGGPSISEVRAMSKVLFARLEGLEEGTPEHQYVRHTLIELNTALVKFAARRFRNRADQMEDILQVGTIGLIKAIDRYDLAFGTEFVTFAIPTIVGEMKRFFRDTSWSVHVPRRLQEMRLDLSKAADELAAELGRSPTVGELAARLDRSEEEVIEAQVAANAYTVASLDAPAGPEDDGPVSWAERIVSDDAALDSVENITALIPLIAALPARERRILALRFTGELTQAQIAAELGLSQMHISRILSTTCRRLRRQLTTED